MKTNNWRETVNDILFESDISTKEFERLKERFISLFESKFAELINEIPDYGKESYGIELENVELFPIKAELKKKWLKGEKE